MPGASGLCRDTDSPSPPAFRLFSCVTGKGFAEVAVVWYFLSFISDLNLTDTDLSSPDSVFPVLLGFLLKDS